jgi:hypothetical protein
MELQQEIEKVELEKIEGFFQRVLNMSYWIKTGKYNPDDYNYSSLRYILQSKAFLQLPFNTMFSLYYNFTRL